MSEFLVVMQLHVYTKVIGISMILHMHTIIENRDKKPKKSAYVEVEKTSSSTVESVNNEDIYKNLQVRNKIWKASQRSGVIAGFASVEADDGSCDVGGSCVTASSGTATRKRKMQIGVVTRFNDNGAGSDDAVDLNAVTRKKKDATRFCYSFRISVVDGEGLGVAASSGAASRKRKTQPDFGASSRASVDNGASLGTDCAGLGVAGACSSVDIRTSMIKYEFHSFYEANN